MDFHDELELLSTLLDRPTPPASPARDGQLQSVSDVRANAQRQTPARPYEGIYGQQVSHSAYNGSMPVDRGSHVQDWRRPSQGHGQQPTHPTQNRGSAYGQQNKTSFWSSMYGGSQPPLIDAGQLRGNKSQQGHHHTCAAEIDVQPGRASPAEPRPPVRASQDAFAGFMDDGYLTNRSLMVRYARTLVYQPLHVAVCRLAIINLAITDHLVCSAVLGQGSRSSSSSSSSCSRTRMVQVSSGT